MSVSSWVISSHFITNHVRDCTLHTPCCHTPPQRCDCYAYGVLTLPSVPQLLSSPNKSPRLREGRYLKVVRLKCGKNGIGRRSTGLLHTRVQQFLHSMALGRMLSHYIQTCSDEGRSSGQAELVYQDRWKLRMKSRVRPSSQAWVQELV